MELPNIQDFLLFVFERTLRYYVRVLAILNHNEPLFQVQVDAASHLRYSPSERRERTLEWLETSNLGGWLSSLLLLTGVQRYHQEGASNKIEIRTKKKRNLRL